ncbi:MAG: PEP-CTERM sorting domain-containing protein [Luteolibacter sp.]
MKKTLHTLGALILVAGTAHATVIALDLPTAGTYANSSVFTTSASHAGTTFDVEYTLVASTTSTTVTLNANSINSNGTIFGVATSGDGNANAQRSIDEGNEEQLSISGLSITNFDPGTSGLVIGDLDISFDSITFTNATSPNDGVAISFTGFGTSVENEDSPSVVDLTALGNFSSTSDSLFLESDSAVTTNRWSVSGISVNVIPEPSTSMLLIGAIGLLASRRRRF